MLQNFVDGYNATVHRTIKMAPKDVNDDNILTVYYNAYHDKRNIKPPKQIYKVGNYVRISKYKHVFEKGYENNWSEEIFKITNVIKRIPIVYKISDLLDEPIVGTFYHQELQRVNYSPDATFPIERVLKKRYKRGNCEILVQWKNYPPKFNTWIPASSLTQL